MREKDVDKIDYSKLKQKITLNILIDTSYKLELLTQHLGPKSKSAFVDRLICEAYKKKFNTEKIY